MKMLIASIVVGLLAAASWAQGSPDQTLDRGRDSAQGNEPAAGIGGAGLDPDPVRVESIGLEINLPRDTRAESVRYGTNTSTAVTLPDGLGVLLIKEQKTTREDLTALGVLDNVGSQLIGAMGFTLVERVESLRVGVWEGSRLYVQKLDGQKQNETGTRGYRGVTVFSHKARSFLIFDLSYSGDAAGFARSRRLYESIVATMNLDAVAGESLQRAAGLRATDSMLSQMSIEDFDAVLTGRSGERWERLYSPGATGDVMDDAEHGYRRIRSWAGYKGELRTAERSEWKEEDRELGYLLQIDAMALETGLRVDSRSVFFVSLDGEEETWTIRMSLTQNGEKTVSSSTGVRIGDQLSVSTVQGGEPPMTVRPQVPELGYVPQVYSYLMGPMIVHKGLVGDFASYAYNSATDSVSLRWDRVSRSETDPDRWVVRTKISTEAPVSTGLYGADGGLMRVTLANGRVWEPIELGSLVDLWERKGLPLR